MSVPQVRPVVYARPTRTNLPARHRGGTIHLWCVNRHTMRGTQFRATVFVQQYSATPLLMPVNLLAV